MNIDRLWKDERRQIAEGANRSHQTEEIDAEVWSVLKDGISNFRCGISTIPFCQFITNMILNCIKTENSSEYRMMTK